MIYGRGDIASVLTDRNLFTFFAKGVSNSLCTDVKEFEREKYEMSKAYHFNNKNRFVYFSTLSIYDKDTPYTRFKISQENHIRQWYDNYCIVRIGNITWGNNPNTIINTFKSQIANREPSRIEDRYKYICTKDEFLYWINLIPNFNTEMNITGERLTIQQIYDRCKQNVY